MLRDASESRFQGVDKSSTAYRLLASMGWEEGEGLGAQKQGIATHVRVKRKADASGVGAAQEAAKAKDWTLGMAAYDKVLAALKTVAAGSPAEKPRRKKKRKDAKEIEEQTSAAKLISHQALAPEQQTSLQQQMPRKKRKMHKWKQPAQAQLALVDEAQGVIQTKRPVTHVGRFQKVTKNKLVKGYSATDLAAILGTNAEDQVTNDTLQPEQQPEWTTRAISARETATDALTDMSDETETGNLWWQGHFTKAGRSGSGYAAFTGTSKRDVNVTGFSETDQANLWQNVTDAQSKLKQGLGQGSAFKLPAKERWQGKKTRIADSDEDESESFIEPDTEADVVLEGCEATVLPSQRSQGTLLGSASDSRPQAQDRASHDCIAKARERPLKWKKISRAILESSATSLIPLKAFKAQAWEVALAKGAVNRKETLQELMGILDQSKQFVIANKAIRLAEGQIDLK